MIHSCSGETMKKQLLSSVLAVGTLAIGCLGQMSSAEAASLTVNLQEFTGDDAGGKVTLTEVTGGSIDFLVDLTSPTVNGDIQAVFFDIFNESLLSGLSATGTKVTATRFEANSVCSVGSSGNNLNGGGSANPCPFDIGVAIGNVGAAGGRITSTTFTLSHSSSNLTLAQFFDQGFGLRVQSTGGNFNGSSKLKGTAPLTPDVETPIPTPALLPGLIGMGAAALRKKKREGGTEEVAQEA
jgi:hypothetical protein